MANCPQCGIKTSDGALFCVNCGSELPVGRKRSKLVLWIVIPVAMVVIAVGVLAYLWAGGILGGGGPKASDPGKDAVSLMFTAEPFGGRQVDGDSVAECVKVLRDKLLAGAYDSFAVAGDEAGTITVKVPKGSDQAAVTRLVTGATLEFVDARDLGAAYSTESEAMSAAGAGPAATLPAGARIVHWPARVDAVAATDRWFVLTDPATLDGQMLDGAASGYDSNNQPKVDLSFTGAGTVVLAQITRELADRARSTGEDQLLAIVVDGEVKSAPRVLEEIPDGLAEITGRFTLDEVKSLVAVLNSGQVPLRLRPAQAH